MEETEGARSATEQSDVNMRQAEMTRSASEQLDKTGPTGPAGQTDSIGLVPARNPGTLPSCYVHARFREEVHVDFNDGYWWAMTHWLSDLILNKYNNGKREVSFVWNWGQAYWGSYKVNGVFTSLSRYIIDFDTMHQRNIDNGRTRNVRRVHVVR